MLKTEEYLIETADRCTRLAREGRDLIEQLEAISNELMARAVELDTKEEKRRQAYLISSGLQLESKSPAVEPGFLLFGLPLRPLRASRRRRWPAG